MEKRQYGHIDRIPTTLLAFSLLVFIIKKQPAGIWSYESTHIRPLNATLNLDVSSIFGDDNSTKKAF